MFSTVQEEVTPDWAEGLPLDVLALVAGGKDKLKAMRGVCKSWQQGFDVSAVTLRVSRVGPLLPTDGSLSQRFPGLVRLDLGLSLVPEADLEVLSSLQRLRSLTLGKAHSSAGGLGQGGLWERLTGAGAQHLGSLQLEFLGLGGCNLLADEDYEVLQGQPLASLELMACFGLRGPGLQYLQGMPLVKLDLCQCSRLASLRGLRNLPLTRLRLTNCVKLTSLEDLKGLPLQTLKLDGCVQLNDSDIEHLQDLPLTHLNLSGWRQLTGEGLEFLQEMPLRILNLSGCKLLVDADLGFLSELPLVQLNLSHCPLLVKACPILARFYHLKHVDMVGCTGIPVNGLAAFLCIHRF